jgi:lambda repressor-like predicted transcriptional regulator
MHQEVKSRFRELLDSRRPKTSIAALAKVLMVSETTVSNILQDKWTSVERIVLERFADFVKCQIQEIFETTSSPFWDSFKETDVCIFCHEGVPETSQIIGTGNH